MDIMHPVCYWHNAAIASRCSLFATTAMSPFVLCSLKHQRRNPGLGQVWGPNTIVWIACMCVFDHGFICIVSWLRLNNDFKPTLVQARPIMWIGLSHSFTPVSVDDVRRNDDLLHGLGQKGQRYKGNPYPCIPLETLYTPIHPYLLLYPLRPGPRVYPYLATSCRYTEIEKFNPNPSWINPLPLKGLYSRDPNSKALKSRESINQGSTP